MSQPREFIYPPPPARWALVLGFAAIYLSWGTTYIAMRIGVHDEELPPALFGGSRSALAGLILLGYQAVRGKSLRLPRRDWRGVLLVSWLLFVGGNGLINLSQTWVESGVAAVLAATTPLCIGLFAMLWPQGERLTGRGWLGLLVGLVGVVILVAPRPFRIEVFLQNLSPLLVLGSAAFWALGALFLRRQKSQAPHLTLAGYQMAIGGLSLCCLGLLAGEASRLPETVTPRAAIVYLYLLIVGSLVGFVAFNWLLGHVSATKVGTYAYVNPVVAVLIAWFVGEHITWEIQAGICTILLGVFLVRGGERSPAPSPGPASTGLAEPKVCASEPSLEAG